MASDRVPVQPVWAEPSGVIAQAVSSQQVFLLKTLLPSQALDDEVSKLCTDFLPGQKVSLASHIFLNSPSSFSLLRYTFDGEMLLLRLYESLHRQREEGKDVGGGR